MAKEAMDFEQDSEITLLLESSANAESIQVPLVDKCLMVPSVSTVARADTGKKIAIKEKPKKVLEKEQQMTLPF